MPEIIAYHGKSAAYHQDQVDTLADTGYRLISLSVYGYWKILNFEPQYAAVWVKRSGPEWHAIHGASSEEYNEFFDKWAKKGFHPVLLSAAGVGNDTVFAGTMEKRPGGVPLTRIDLRDANQHKHLTPESEHTIQFWNCRARDKGWALVNGAIYGMDDNHRYAGIWAPIPAHIAWNADGINDRADKYQERFDAQISAQARVSFVTLAPDRQYLSIFRDDHIGPGFTRHNMTSAEYQQEFEDRRKKGMYPICVQGGGIGSSIRYAAIFTKQEKAIERQWQFTGGPAVPEIDDVVVDAMEHANLRAASLAIVKGTRLVLARGYTHAEPGYPTVEPTTIFRIASVSKLITTIAIFQLIEEGKLSLDDKFQDILQLKTLSGDAPADPGFQQITIRQLLDHTSRLRGEGHNQDGLVLADLKTLKPGQPHTFPISHLETEAYLAGLPLTDPVAYNNCAYWVLGRVVAKLRGKSTFVQAIQDTILKPLGIGRFRVSKNMLSQQLAGEAFYHEGRLQVHKSVSLPDVRLVPESYGANNLERGAATGGLSAAAPDLARILAAMNVPSGAGLLAQDTVEQMLSAAVEHFDQGFERAGYGFDRARVDDVQNWYKAIKGGALSSSDNNARYSRDICIVFNRNGKGIGGETPWCKEKPKDSGWFAKLQTAAEKAQWAPGDLFPQYGMPSFIKLDKIGARPRPVKREPRRAQRVGHKD